jgi:type I site-specific restriction endonuclease
MAPAAEDDAVYLAAEARARRDIDRMLEAAGWVVQNKDSVNLGAAPGVAVREFTMVAGHGRADYLLFVNRKAVGVEDLEAALAEFALIAESLAPSAAEETTES